MNLIEIHRLSDLFEKYDFFNDEIEKTPEYSVLLEVYATLTQDSKDCLIRIHNMRMKGGSKCQKQ